MNPLTIFFLVSGGLSFLVHYLRYPFHLFRLGRSKEKKKSKVLPADDFSQAELEEQKTQSKETGASSAKSSVPFKTRMAKLMKAIKQITYPRIIVTQAPAPIKYTRAAFNFILPAVFFFGMFYILLMKGGEGLAQLMQFSDEKSKAVFSILPYFFIVPFLVLKTAKFAYTIYKLILTPMPWLDKIKRLIFKSLLFALSVSVILCGLLLASATPFLVLASVFFMMLFIQQFVDVLHDMYRQKIERNLPINWDLVFATSFMCLTSVILVSCVLAGVLTIGGALFNTLLFFKTAAYVLAQTVYDGASNRKHVSKRRLALQFGLGFGELLAGILLLAHVFTLPVGFIGFMITLLTVKIVMKFAAVEYLRYYHDKSVITTLTSEKCNDELLACKEQGERTSVSTYFKMHYQLRFGERDQKGKIIENQEGLETQYWREKHRKSQESVFEVLLPVDKVEINELRKEGIERVDRERSESQIKFKSTT